MYIRVKQYLVNFSQHMMTQIIIRANESKYQFSRLTFFLGTFTYSREYSLPHQKVSKRVKNMESNFCMKKGQKPSFLSGTFFSFTSEIMKTQLHVS